MTLSDLMLSSQMDDFKNEIKRQHRSLDEFDVSATPLRLDEASGALSAYRGTDDQAPQDRSGTQL